MKQILKEMLEIYKPYSDMDWMNYKLIRSDMTAHHIIKKCDGGQLTLDNICPLRSVSHQYLHIIEFKDIKTYIAINKIFKYVNQQGYEPTLEQREVIEYLLKGFESEHEFDRSSKGKLLIKRKYLERW